jgi:hypothetical protein
MKAFSGKELLDAVIAILRMIQQAELKSAFDH